MWFRRDLRLSDNPALLDAADRDGDVLPLFVLDPALWRPSGPSRRHYLAESLRDLDSRIGLTIRSGDPVTEVVRAAREVGADRVHVAADYGPYGRARDERVDAALAEHDIELVRTGSSYAVAPGRVTKGDGTPYQVFTPFSRAWQEHGWREPAGDLGPVSWLVADSDGVPDEPLPDDLSLPSAGEEAARRRWREYWSEKLEDYDRERDRPDLDSTSHMSVHLKWGEIHPRTMLARPPRPHAARARRPTARSSPGGSSTPTCSSTTRSPRATTCGRSSSGWRTTSRATSSPRGGRAAPASPSSTPACASCARPAGCTTGCG